jgi:hypothetical protein
MASFEQRAPGMSTPTPSSVPLHPLPRKHWPGRLSVSDSSLCDTATMTTETGQADVVAGALEQLRAVHQLVVAGVLEATPEHEAWLRGATDALQVVVGQQ